MSETIQMKIQSDPKHLAASRKFIEEHAKKAGFDELTVSQIVLAVDEAVTNIMRYSYDMKPDCDIEFTVTHSKDHLKVALRDYGKQCDLAKIKPRELHEVRPGGLGTHFIQTVMDEVSYHHKEPGTELVMVKKRTPEKP